MYFLISKTEFCVSIKHLCCEYMYTYIYNYIQVTFIYWSWQQKASMQRDSLFRLHWPFLMAWSKSIAIDSLEGNPLILHPIRVKLPHPISIYSAPLRDMGICTIITKYLEPRPICYIYIERERDIRYDCPSFRKCSRNAVYLLVYPHFICLDIKGQSISATSRQQKLRSIPFFHATTDQRTSAGSAQGTQAVPRHELQVYSTFYSVYCIKLNGSW